MHRFKRVKDVRVRENRVTATRARVESRVCVAQRSLAARLRAFSLPCRNVVARWFVREESRILGVFGTERLNVDADGRVQPRAPRPRMPPFATGFKDG